MRIAIISPNRNAWSETFIAAHIERLPGVGLVLTDGHLPQRDAQGAPLLPQGLATRLMRRFTGTTVHEALRARVKQAIVRSGVDVVLAEYGPTGEAMLPICREAGIPLVVHFHGIDAFHHKLLHENGAYKGIIGGAAALVVVSREMEQQLLALGAARERLHYNCYGVDVLRFTTAAPQHAPPTFLAVGRFVDKKAPHLTLLAFERALRHEPAIRLVMAGQGPLWESVRQMALALGIADRVELPGVLSHERVAERMQSVRAFVQHSVITSDNDHEGTPLSVLEAMASAIPVVATRHAGIPDVVEHGVHGLLCAERDVETMAAHMLQLAREPGTAQRMGLAARERVMRHHDQAHSLEALAGILRKVCGK